MKKFQPWACTTLAFGAMAVTGGAEVAEGDTDLFKTVAGQAKERLSETFQYANAGEKWGETLTRWSPSGRSYVGTGKSGETLTFQTDELGPHHAVLINVKLFVIYHWDGNWTVYGPDLFRVQLDRNRELARTSFSNYGIVGQSYPDDWPWGEHAARTGAAETGTLGWKYPGNWGEPLDAVYDIRMGAVRNGGDLRLDFRGDFQDDRDPPGLRGEQWGIESLEILTFHQSVELPDATWETLAANLLGNEPAKVAEARALLPLGDIRQIIKAIDHAALRHSLDPQTLEEKTAAKETESPATAVAETLESAAATLRRQNGDTPTQSPSRAALASRLYQVLTLMNAAPQWRQLLWSEMNRVNP